MQAIGSLLKSPQCNAETAAVDRLMDELATGPDGDVRPDGDVLGPIVREHLHTGGKRLRARLALASAQALGADMSSAVPWAAACEIAHNATLVHDDLQDGDRVRRGHPTTWVQHGMAQAINAGDLLFMMAYQAIAAAPQSAEVRADLSAAMGRRIADVCRGQAAELALNEIDNPQPEQYEKAIVGKTSALFQLPVQGAALVAGRDAGRATTLAEPFEPLGILFQMQDDVLDLYGEKGRDAVGSDIREGKVSALVVEHLRAAPDDRAWLFDLLRKPREQTSTDNVQKAIARFRESGALNRVLQRIHRESERVRSHPLCSVEPQLGRLATELVALVLAPIAHLMPVP